jgi:hypothetical protein
VKNVFFAKFFEQKQINDNTLHPVLAVSLEFGMHFRIYFSCEKKRQSLGPIR